MAYTLDTEELAAAALSLGLNDEVKAFGDAHHALAKAIADKVGVVAPSQGSEIDGYATFQPAHPGQPLPDALEGFDNDEEWEPSDA